MDDLLARLRDGRDALTPALREAFVAIGPTAVPPLRAVVQDASQWSAWAPIHAARLLGIVRAADAVPDLLRILEGAEEEDRLSAEAIRALVEIGPAALDGVAAFLTVGPPPRARALALEALRGLLDDCPPERRTVAREALEAELRQGDAIAAAACLAELGDADAIPALLFRLGGADLSHAAYEAVRDAVERLGGACPGYYFESTGRGYPLDEEKLPHCPSCGAAMIILETGELAHVRGSCTTGDVDNGRGWQPFPPTS